MFGLVVLFHMASAESKSASESAGVFWNEIAVESSMGFSDTTMVSVAGGKNVNRVPIQWTRTSAIAKLFAVQSPCWDGCTNHSQFRVRIIGHTFGNGYTDARCSKRRLIRR